MKVTQPWRERSADTSAVRFAESQRSATQRERCESLDQSPALLSDAERAELTAAMETGSWLTRLRAQMHLHRDAKARGQSVGSTAQSETLRSDSRGLAGRGGGKAGPVLPLMTTRGWADAIVRVWLFPTW